MTPITRRFALATSLAAITDLFARSAGYAQYTEQQITNGVQVTSTGNVRIQQAASGQQDVGVLIDGRLETEDGIYRTRTGQVVLNDGQVTATGDVDVVQSASGQQTVTTRVLRDGTRADRCDPGHVIADPTTGQLYYQADDCCYYLSPCCGGCRGGRC